MSKSQPASSACARAFADSPETKSTLLMTNWLSRNGFVPRIVLLDGVTAVLVEEAEEQIEPPQQLDEPLMDQRLRHQDEHALRAPGQVQPMQDQARLDRLAQAHFVGQQHARHQREPPLRWRCKSGAE